jgi:type VI secretion system FHA domain protein
MIWIRIVSKDGAPASSLALGVPLAARFGDSVGDVGRGVGCTLVLPDPNREISRKQALVTWQSGRHFIRPIGTNVDIELNGRVLPPDVEAPLDVGAEIRIGPYLMRVERLNADNAAPTPPMRPAIEPPPIRPSVEAPPIRPLEPPRAQPAALTPRPQHPGAPRPPSAPRALAAAPPAARPAALQSPPGAQAAPPPPHAQPAQSPPRGHTPQLPAHAQPAQAQRGNPAPSPPQPASPARNAGQDPLAILNTPNRPAKSGVFDDLLKSAIGQPRPAGAPQQPQSPSRPQPKPGDLDRPRPAPPQAPPAQSAPQSKADRPQRAAMQPAKPTAPDKARLEPGRQEAARQEPGRQVAPERGAASNDEFVGALYGGLGIAAPPQGERSADKGRLIGELLRESLAGTIELLAARQIAKKNLGASATMLQTRGNNPLKFSPNVDAALTHLLGPPMRGFIGPREAVHDALGDLRAHQVAMLAGMRAALEAVLERFDPVALEARLAPKGMVEQLMPVNRRARLWETFGEQYASILREVEDDWDALFGKAFLQAYERQLAELEREPDENGN